ncbi:MAG: thioredoxin domain-containing protein [Haliscomenobacter sp.]|nr:thioredoxin domain-containing protein [Haliscomenobacter sp.]
MNRLQLESSPYLRQHAANPVDWYAWGEEALGKARRENKPVLVSIGYSTCHWCHVMERESFEDPEVAALMNHYFINIKIDREERPDLDQLYMDACQALTGTGGWPLNVFLTPEGKPFFAGTYFPPQPGFKRMSWVQALEYAAYNFYENREAVDRQAERIAGTLLRAEQLMTATPFSPLQGEAPFSPSWAEQVFQMFRTRFDVEEGGFDQAPKFPNTMALEFLLRYATLFRSREAWDHVAFSLQKILYGGIFDQLGGGVARYATDRTWFVPHFEKMLYDNALLARLLADAYRVSPQPLFREGLEATLGFVLRELSGPDGRFYAALDADAEGEEGGYYTWYADEIKTILGEDTEWFMGYFNATEGGNWEAKNILYRREPAPDFARRQGLDPAFFESWLDRVKKEMLEVRLALPRPHRDENVLLGWNALAVNAFTHAFHALGNPEYQARALDGMTFLQHRFLAPDGETLFHQLDEGEKPGMVAFLNDYAFFIEALLDVYTLDFNPDRLRLALRLTETAIRDFYDEEDGLFFFTEKGREDLFLRRKELYDAEMPSGIATMISNLQRLSVIFDRRDLRALAEKAMRAVRNTVTEDPMPFARYASAMLQETHGTAEIAVVGPDAYTGAAALCQKFLPGVVLMADERENPEFPLLSGRGAAEGRTAFYLCQDYACQRPVDSAEAVWKSLSFYIP